MIKKQITSLLLVYSRRKGLSTDLRMDRLGRQNRINQGFLLIEAIVALAALGIITAGIASLQGYVVQHYTDATHQLAATTIAMTYLGNPPSKPVATQGIYTIKTTLTDINDENIPYKMVTVTVFWKNARGETKELSMMGGIVPYAS